MIQIKDVYIPGLNAKNNIDHVIFIINMLLPKMKLNAKILNYMSMEI